MEIVLHYTGDENNKINKTFSVSYTLAGTLRDGASVISPVILVEGNTFGDYNYAYIPQFERYYFIREIENYRNNLWILHLEVDVLKSFAESILNLHAILLETEATKADQYLSDNRVWVAKVKDKTNIINFPNGLLDSGEYILLTAGG